MPVDWDAAPIDRTAMAAATATTTTTAMQCVDRGREYDADAPWIAAAAITLQTRAGCRRWHDDDLRELFTRRPGGQGKCNVFN
jgi:hypothetical protein